MAKKSITVTMAARGNVNPIRSACFAALTCYMMRFPKWGKLIDWFAKLFKTGHHTTFMHSASYFTFNIDGISVGDVTFGLHLCNPFYNTSQRSGRYCATMFLKFVRNIKNSLREILTKYFPSYVPKSQEGNVGDSSPEEKLQHMRNYIREFWPEISEEKAFWIMDYYVSQGINIFQNNIEEATLKAAEIAIEDRPFLSPEKLEELAPRFAQEQLRNFIPILAPTGLVYTVNLITLVALWESAFTPPMRYVSNEMARLVLEKYPDLAPMFNEKNRRQDDWAATISKEGKDKQVIVTEPVEKVLAIDGADNFVSPRYKDRHPVNKLHFTPELMNNSIGSILSMVKISVATMGQDQRHRTINRGMPFFTGEFYRAPILCKMALEGQSFNILRRWKTVAADVPPSLAMILAPYGAVVTYEKRGSFLAVDHEKGKRTCFCAQEEIYWCGVQSQRGVKDFLGPTHPLVDILEPPCYQTGTCSEGGRYCGRDISQRKNGDYFPRRKI